MRPFHTTIIIPNHPHPAQAPYMMFTLMIMLMFTLLIMLMPEMLTMLTVNVERDVDDVEDDVNDINAGDQDVKVKMLMVMLVLNMLLQMM